MQFPIIQVQIQGAGELIRFELGIDQCRYSSNMKNSYYSTAAPRIISSLSRVQPPDGCELWRTVLFTRQSRHTKVHRSFGFHFISLRLDHLHLKSFENPPLNMHDQSVPKLRLIGMMEYVDSWLIRSSRRTLKGLHFRFRVSDFPDLSIFFSYVCNPEHGIGSAYISLCVAREATFSTSTQCPDEKVIQICRFSVHLAWCMICCRTTNSVWRSCESTLVHVSWR